jgi:hypothetical protein
MKATAPENDFNQKYINVPNTGLFPMLLLELLSNDKYFILVRSLTQVRDREENHYTQVLFYNTTDPNRIFEILYYLNKNS